MPASLEITEPSAFQTGTKAPVNTPLPKHPDMRPLIPKEENFHIVPEENSGITHLQGPPPPGLSIPENPTPEPESFSETNYPKLGNNANVAANMNGWQKLENSTTLEEKESTPVKTESDESGPVEVETPVKPTVGWAAMAKQNAGGTPQQAPAQAQRAAKPVQQVYAQY